MIKSTVRHKTIEESKKVCLKVRERKNTMLESLHRFAEVIEAETLIKELPDEIKTAREEIKRSAAEFAALQPMTQKQTEYNDRLKREVDKKEANLVSLTSEVEQLGSRVERQEKKIDDIEIMKKRTAELEFEKDGIDSMIKEIETGVEQLRNDTSSMQSKLAEDNETMNTLETEKQQLTMEVEGLLGKIKKSGSLDAGKNELTGLEAENNKIETSINEFKKTLTADDQLKIEITSSIKNLDEQTAAITGDVEELSVSAESLRQTVISKDEAHKLQTQLNAAAKERDGSKERIEKTDQEIEGHLKSKGGIIKKVEDAGFEFDAMIEEHNSYKEEVEVYEKAPEQLERLKNDIPELKKIRDEHIKKSHDAHERLAHLNNAVDIISTELNEHKNAMAQLGSLLN